MLGIRFKPEFEEQLARHAKALGKPTSTMARDWILERFERESANTQMRRAAQILAAHDREADYTESDMDD